jgi:uncharacterized tellurite resistance protein B-like protein
LEFNGGFFNVLAFINWQTKVLIMAFWDIFTKSEPTDENSRLYYKMRELLPNQDEQELIYIACLSGLLARVIHVDLKIDEKEISSFKSIINDHFSMEAELGRAIVELALNNVQELIDLDNQKYTKPLVDRLSEKKRYEILQLLFEVSAADGVVENIESEEIRLVAKGLCLSEQHFLAARAEVRTKLGATKKI